MGLRKRHVVELQEGRWEGRGLVNRGGGYIARIVKPRGYRSSERGAAEAVRFTTLQGEGGEVTRVCINKPDLVPRVVGLRSPSLLQSMRGMRGSKSVNRPRRLSALEDSSSKRLLDAFHWRR